MKIRDAFDFSHLGEEEQAAALVAERMRKRKREDISPNRRPNSLHDLEVNPLERSLLHYLNKNLEPLQKSGVLERSQDRVRLGEISPAGRTPLSYT